jgi:ComF family protein
MGLWRDFVLLLFPEACVGCRASLLSHEAPLCTACRVGLPRTGYLADPDNPIAQKFWGRLPLAHASAYLHFVKRGVGQELVHALKYQGQQEVGRLLGQLYGAELAQAGVAGFDLVLPVPLHASKLRRRGFNQSDPLAEGLAAALGVPWSPTVVQRARATLTQTRKGRAERWENVEDIFRVAEQGEVAGRSILLVDDVVTTGATLEACGAALLRAGCTRLGVAALAGR